MRPNAQTQKNIVLDHLKDFGYITSWDAIKYYHITRLAEYIRQLRNEYHRIHMIWQTDPQTGKRWGKYIYQGTSAALSERGTRSLSEVEGRTV